MLTELEKLRPYVGSKQQQQQQQQVQHRLFLMDASCESMILY